MARDRHEVLLVLRAQSGDRRALDALLQRVQAPLFRYIRGIVGEADRAEDVVQDVFVLICRKLKWLREPRFFRAWAYRIASREALRCVRRDQPWRAQVRDPDVLDQIADDDEARAAIRERVADLATLVAAVPPASRMVLLLHYQEELTLQAVADVLDLPLGTVKSRLAYGLSALRAAVKRTS